MHIGREVLPSVNIHHAPPLVQRVVIPSSGSRPSVVYDSGLYPIQELLSMPQNTDQNLWNDLTPYFVTGQNTAAERYDQRYPIGLSSSGIFSLHGRATLGDGRDRPQAQSNVQQLSQVSGKIAKSIETQADWELLRRFGFLVN